MEQIQLRASISMKEDRAGFQIVSDIVSQAKTIIATNQKIAKQAIISLLGVIVFVFSLLILMNY
jgi:hypothetical protein